MFTLKKILNSNTSTAEPVRMPTASGTAYKLGSLLILKDGAVTNCAATEFPDFVAGETLAAGERDSVICYPIFPDMLFEVPAASNAASLVPGTKLALALSSGFAVKISSIAENGVATVFDTQSAAKSGDKILVRFIK